MENDLTEAQVQHAMRLWMGNYLCNEQNMEIEEAMLFVMDHEDELIAAMEDGIYQWFQNRDDDEDEEGGDDGNDDRGGGGNDDGRAQEVEECSIEARSATGRMTRPHVYHENPWQFRRGFFIFPIKNETTIKTNRPLLVVISVAVASLVTSNGQPALKS